MTIFVQMCGSVWKETNLERRWRRSFFISWSFSGLLKLNFSFEGCNYIWMQLYETCVCFVGIRIVFYVGIVVFSFATKYNANTIYNIGIWCGCDDDVMRCDVHVYVMWWRCDVMRRNSIGILYIIYDLKIYCRMHDCRMHAMNIRMKCSSNTEKENT